jgi:predicted Zn-dependent peptidase
VIRAAAWLLALGSVAACGGTSGGGSSGVVTGPPEIVGNVEGVTLAIVPRATEGWAWVALWIDAGSRDAEPPVLATLAAWAAIDGSEITARVLPDGIELAIGCRTEQIDRCLQQLAGVLERRQLPEGAISAARERIRGARRGAQAEEQRVADRLAIASLVGGEEARALDPLGSPGELETIGARDAELFLARHWGGRRALAVVVGDADEEAVRASVARHFAGVPDASEARAARSITPHVGAAVEVGDRAVASAAIAVRTRSDGVAIARRALAELPEASASVFPLRGGEIVLVRGNDPRAVAASLIYAQAITPATDAVPLGQDDVRSIADRLGSSWVARADAIAPEGGLGIGAVVAGGRADRDAEDPDAPARERTRGELAALATELAASLGGTIEREEVAGTISLESSDGARARVRSEALGRVAIAVAIESRAESESPRAHGARRLITSLLARCASGEGSVETWVGTESIGLVIESVPERALAAIDRAGRCVRALPLDPRAIELERALRIGAIDLDDVRRSRAALALAPGAPAMIAFDGTRATIAAIDVRSLERTWRAVACRERVSIGIAGDVDPAIAAQVALLAIRRLPGGCERPPVAERIDIAAEEMILVRSEDDAVEVLLALRDPTPRRGGRAGARAALRALIDALGSGARAVWADAGAGTEGAWAAIALRADEDTIATLHARLESARRAATSAVGARLDAELARESERRAWSGASAQAIAIRLATGADELPDRDASAAAAAAILAAPARWVFARTAR